MSRILDQLFLLVLAISLTFLTGCSQGLFGAKEITNDGEVNQQENNPPKHAYDVNLYKMNKVVCDPMGGGGDPGMQSGLKAELYYLTAGQPHYQNVQEYYDHGTKSTQDLFFSDLNVPTRLFGEGFPIQSGGLVQDDQGQDLIEYFALRFKSTLKLTPDDPEGDYELALLSDDGSLLRFNGQGVVDNDHNHPTRMGCGDTVFMSYDSSFETEIDYYQGPRHHISLIPMWRRVTAGTQPESECGKLGNSRYFDFNNGSTPTNNYLGLLARGWKPIASGNWHLPAEASYNPCVEGTNPVISNFAVIDIGEGFAQVVWNTDIPATSQVMVTDANGVQTITDSDNVLRTSHQIIIDDGIDFGETYQFQAISISADMGKSLSEIIEETF